MRKFFEVTILNQIQHRINHCFHVALSFLLFNKKSSKVTMFFIVLSLSDDNGESEWHHRAICNLCMQYKRLHAALNEQVDMTFTPHECPPECGKSANDKHHAVESKKSENSMFEIQMSPPIFSNGVRFFETTVHSNSNFALGWTW